MCGISGILSNKVSVSSRESLVSSMMEKLVHRGPDDYGIHSGTFYTIGHRRLSIIDIENGKQPMVSDDGRYSLVFNGEIYNYLELRQRLIQKGKHFKTHSDTEVLLKLLVEEGEEALNRLNGMFAFAFIDNHSGEWILARDHFGIKPLYYFIDENKIIFASEIKAILADTEIRALENWSGIEQYLTFQFCLGENTLFKDIKKIEPGWYIKGNFETIKEKKCYWDTSYSIDEFHTEAYFIEELRYLLDDSLKLQIRSDVPLGAYLSGGLDSSIVSSYASRHLESSIPVFNGVFKEKPEYDESYFAKIISKSIQAQYFEIIPTEKDFVDSIPKLIYMMDEPVAGPGLFPQYIVSKFAAKHVKVILGGQGGDEIFGGYARYLVCYLEQALKGAIFESQDEGQHIVTLKSIIPNLTLLKQYKPLIQHLFKEEIFEEMDKRYFRVIDRSPDLKDYLTEDVLNKIQKEKLFIDFQKIFNHPDTKSYFNKMTHFDQKTMLPSLLQVEDRVSMSVSLESRVPLLDHRIADLISKVPPLLKFQGGKTKYILKEAVKNFLPDEILNRKDKMGFPVPLKEWMQKGIVRDFVLDIILSKKCKERGIYKTEALSNLVANEKSFGRQLWGVLCLELWFQTFIDE